MAGLNPNDYCTCGFQLLMNITHRVAGLVILGAIGKWSALWMGFSSGEVASRMVDARFGVLQLRFPKWKKQYA